MSLREAELDGTCARLQNKITYIKNDSEYTLPKDEFLSVNHIRLLGPVLLTYIKYVCQTQAISTLYVYFKKYIVN